MSWEKLKAIFQDESQREMDKKKKQLGQVEQQPEVEQEESTFDVFKEPKVMTEEELSVADSGNSSKLNKYLQDVRKAYRKGGR